MRTSPSRTGGLLALAVVVLSLVLGGVPSPVAGIATPQALPAFYVVPSPLPDAPPGTLIRSEDLGPVPGGQRFRVMYHSRTFQGADIAVTGLVFVPSAPAPPGGRPILTWAHGTTGTADQCAPSLGGYDPELLSDWLGRGYIVAATDYEGLGTPGLHPYLMGESEGRGVLDAARLAKAWPGAQATGPVVIYGHSQGGQSAIFAGELAPTYAPDLDVVGTIAAAPASQIGIGYAGVDTGPVIRAAVIMMTAGFAEQYGLDPHDVLTDEAVDRMGVVDTACSGGVAAAYADLSGPQTVKALPMDVPAWAAVLQAAEPGYRTASGPTLIVHGTADEQVPYVASQLLDQRLCETGQPHRFTTYPGVDHGDVITSSRTEVLDFADAVVAGEAVPLTTCPTPPTTDVPSTDTPIAMPAAVVATPSFTG